jgi:hypothetical protein
MRRLHEQCRRGTHAESSSYRRLVDCITAMSEELGSWALGRTMLSSQATSINTTTSRGFGTPIDVTLSELAIESFFPADRHTQDILNSSVTAGQAARQPLTND